MSEPTTAPTMLITPTGKISQERAAMRYQQIVVIEREIATKALEITTCKDHLSGLKEEYEGLIHRLRQAARDEGDLPLFNL